MSMTPAQESRKFVSVLADGKMHLEVSEGTEGAVLRKYKTSDGTEGSKWELLFADIAGLITAVEFKEGKFGNQLMVTITDGDEEPVVLALGTASNFGEDLMKKLPRVDLSKRVILSPYSFTDDKGKSKRGITVKQDEEKLPNFFYDVEGKKNLHGFPVPKKGKVTKANPEGTLTKDQWKLYFGECREFLTEYITEKVMPKLSKDKLTAFAGEMQADEIDME